MKRFIKPNLRNKLVSMQKERKLDKKKLGNDERLNESGKKSRGSGMKKGERNNVLLTNNEKRKDKSDMSGEEERIPATDIEAITFLEATTVTKVLACQHLGIEIMIDGRDPERARPRLLLPRHLPQSMIRAWRRRPCNYSSKKAKS